MDDTDLRIIHALHGGFPLAEQPYRAVADALELTEPDLIARLKAMLEAGTLTRFGPLFQVEKMGGAFVLAALAVPEEHFETVAGQVNSLPEVAHNYRREHRLNMWFVLATETPAGIPDVITRIETLTGLTVHAFPKEREYFVDMRRAFAFPGAPAHGDSGEAIWHMAGPSPLPGSPSDLRRLVVATQAGLPLLARPYHALAAQLGVTADEIRGWIAHMLASGTIRRIGAVPNHYALGYTANGMSVWDVDSGEVDALGERVGALAFVTHCYRRPRSMPDWPYNLFAMVHGRSRTEVEERVAQIAGLLGTGCQSGTVLYSSRILKKSGLRLSN